MYDVAIIGSGFGGAASAIMLAKLGHTVALIEKGKHPRFALGESTTPIMSKTIRHLGQKYDIPEFVNLASYDTIMSAHMPITCGPKELFHYFWHEPGLSSATLSNGIVPEIIVQTPEVDTQLYRAESDKYLVDVAISYGADYFEETTVEDIEFNDDGAVIKCSRPDGSASEIKTRFIIDGTGHRSLISQRYDLIVPQEELDTPLNSRSIFTHFKDVGDFESSLECDDAFIGRTPVPRIRGTQHHCFDGGWIWFIPFDNGVTSVGLNLDIDTYPINGKTGEEEFWEIIGRYPIVEKMLKGRETLMPFIKTKRIQFRTKQAVGDRWAMLPGSAVGGDGWFSTGLGFTLLCAHRIVDMLHTKMLKDDDFSRQYLENYETALFKEWKYVCRMVDGIYKSMRHFEVFKYYCFFCFMGAESFVHRGGIKRPHDLKYLLLNVGDDNFVAKFEEFYTMVKDLHGREEATQEQLDYLRDFVRYEMKDYNYRDYGNPIYGGVHRRLDKSSRYFAELA
ncbi:NAD(P)/FAD-dependent oxidoreductase [Hahella chejuensis]|nr:FAD-dependent oxidoreductase [Hahella chejuensis]